MSVYFVKGKGWRYDFTLKGQRFTGTWFKAKREAREAEALQRKEAKNPKAKMETPTDMVFLDLVNMRLDHVRAYNSERHYRDYLYMARRWVERWGKLSCDQITQQMVEQFILARKKVSPFTANKEIRYLRATFNFGKKKQLITRNPVDGIEFLPVEKKVKYIPSPEDLYTRKKKGGHLSPRPVPMTSKLYEILSHRYQQREDSIPWVFGHRYCSSKTREWKEGPYQDRKGIMKTLCKKAGVRYFRFHALRHSGASLMDRNNVPIGSIQRILGHQNRTTTEIYLHSMSDAEREAMVVYEHARQNSHTNSHTNENKVMD